MKSIIDRYKTVIDSLMKGTGLDEGVSLHKITFNPPLEESVVARFEKSSRQRVPIELIELYDLHNGATSPGPLFYNARWPSFEEAMRQHMRWCHVFLDRAPPSTLPPAIDREDDATSPTHTDSTTNSPANCSSSLCWQHYLSDVGVKTCAYNRSWYPVFFGPDNYCYFVDYDPQLEDGGVYGQIVFGLVTAKGMQQVGVVAFSLNEFLDTFVGALETNNAIYSPTHSSFIPIPEGTTDARDSSSAEADSDSDDYSSYMLPPSRQKR